MIYCPKELVLGTGISIISVIIFFLLIIFEKKLCRINGYGEFFAIPKPAAPEQLPEPEPEPEPQPDEMQEQQEPDTDQTTQQ